MRVLACQPPSSPQGILSHDREQCLVDTVDVDPCLSKEESAQLLQFLTEQLDVFAMDLSEWLTALTRKHVPFERDEVCQVAFTELKRLLTEAPQLAFPNFTRDFLLETPDVSGIGLGLVSAGSE